MPDENQYLRPEYKRLVLAKMFWYSFISGVFVANIFVFSNLAVNILNAVLACVFLAFAIQTWRLR